MKHQPRSRPKRPTAADVPPDSAPPPAPKPAPATKPAPAPAAKPATAPKAKAETKPLPKKTDNMMDALSAVLRKEFGLAAVPTAVAATQLAAVIPCPLALEFMTGVSGLPVARVYEFSSQSGQGKTALVSEFGRIVSAHLDGVFALIENECRLDMDWVQAVYGETPRFVPMQSESLDMSQKLVVRLVQKYQESCLLAAGKRGLLGVRAAPLMVGIDPITGHQAEEVQERIIGKRDKRKPDVRTGGGEAIARNFPVEAGQLARFIRTIPVLLERWPIILVCVNQLRLKPSQSGFGMDKSKAGGEQINFAKNYEFEVYRSSPLESSEFEGHKVTIKLGKSSGASDRRRLTTRLRWWYDKPVDGRPMRKRAAWDWDWALIQLLSDILGTDRYPMLKARLQDDGLHVKATKTGDMTHAAWSATLGMKEAHAVPWDELARMLTSDADLLRRLRIGLGILERPVVRLDYAAQLAQLATKVE